MHPFFKKLNSANESFLIEVEFASELMLCDDSAVVDRALASVPDRMIADSHVRAIVGVIRSGERDPVAIHKKLSGRSPFQSDVPRKGQSPIPTLNVFLGEMLEMSIGKSYVLSRARHVINQYRARSARSIGNRLIKSSARDAEIGSVIRECEESLTKLRSETYSEVRTMPELMSSLMSSFADGKKSRQYPEFGIRRLDEIIGGLEPGSNTVVAALTSVGKSAFVQQSAIHMSKAGWRVLMFTCEMTQEAVAERFVVMETGIASEDIRDYESLDDADKSRVMNASNMLGELPGEIVYCPGWDVEQVIEHCHERHAEAAVDVIIVDYLQLLNSAKRCENSEKQLDYMALALRNMGGKLGAATIVCAQLNDEAEKVKPRIRHLRGSKSPGQHSDNVVMLSRGKTGEKSRRCEFFVRKNRNGPLGEFEVAYIPHSYTFDPVDDF